MQRFHSSFLLTCLAGALCGCSVYTPDLLGEEKSGSGSGGSGGDGGNGEMCQGAAFAHAPPRPDATKIRNRSKSLTCTMVQRKLDLGDRDPSGSEIGAFLNIGFDLDDTCTTEENLTEGECTLPPWASGAVDGAGGIDNTLGAIIQGTRNIAGDFTSDNYSKALEAGGVSIMYRITGYNGEQDDDQVEISTFVAARFQSYSGTSVTPNWDGEDIWPISSDSIADPPDGVPWERPLDHPRFIDKNAYVTGGKIVASLKDADLRLQIHLSGLQDVDEDLRLSGAVVVCDMVSTEKGCGFVATHCVLAGRWRTDHLLHQLSQYPDPNPPEGRVVGSPLCTDSPLYANFKQNICASTDTYSGVAVTNSVVCDALSMGVYWDTEPAILGDIFYLDPIVPRCDDSIEPSRDSCDPALSAPDLIFAGSAPSGGTTDGG